MTSCSAHTYSYGLHLFCYAQNKTDRIARIPTQLVADQSPHDRGANLVAEHEMPLAIFMIASLVNPNHMPCLHFLDEANSSTSAAANPSHSLRQTLQ